SGLKVNTIYSFFRVCTTFLIMHYGFFKDISLFDFPTFGFTLEFPVGLWCFRKVSKNEFWFINKNSNQAIILNCYKDQSYNYEMLKSEFKDAVTMGKIGNYDAFISCKKFVKESVLQYEWVLLDLTKKIKFSYPILDEKNKSDKDKDYEVALSILNTIKAK
uniref:hypothetical protein n=2 Tax=Flavobacterium sp. TaxID=239 RepID=UPI004049A544